ncbi:MAG: hypothetical protein IIA91_04375 [Chloroflexi bacterium]|nr:hypothetical protein [Chloroflexota bacterium]
MKTVRRLEATTPRAAAEPEGRPAFYALDLGAWRDYVTLLHPPYTLWHLSYVVLGAALAPTLHYDRLAATLLAFFLGVGVAAHALDELNGRPLRTRIPSSVLILLTAIALVGAVGLGLLGAVVVSPWLLAFVVFGAFILIAYNLELFGGRFHSDFWFALAWGAFPLLTAYWASAERLEPAAAAGAAAAFALSLAQRTLSSRVRAIRRRVQSIEGHITYADGTTETIDKRWALATDERALMLLAATVVTASGAALLARAV